MKENIRKFYGIVTSIHDGDTFRAKIDLGFHCSVNINCRLRTINAAEIGTQGSDEAVAWLRRNVFGRNVEIVSYEMDSFGRWVVDVFLNGANIAEAMIGLGLARMYEQQIGNLRGQ